MSALCGKYHVKLTMLFPENYPYNSPPAFQFSHETNIDQKTEAKLLKVGVTHVCVGGCLNWRNSSDCLLLY